MADIPTLKTWEDISDDPDAPDRPAADEFNEQIKDVVNLTAHPKRCQVRAASLASIDKDTWTLLSWGGSEVADTDEMHDSGQNSRLVAKTAGVYHVHLSVSWQVGSTNVAIPAGVRGIQIRKNSGGTAGGTEICSDRRRAGDWVNGPNNGHTCSGFVKLAVNDYVEAYCRNAQDNIPFVRDQVDMIVSDYLRFSAVWVSTGV